jgi:anti-sigma-K factor RskA
MRYQDPRLRDKLAAEYVLGTLHGRARARFRRLLRADPLLRRAVEDWEERLLPLALGVPGIPPSPAVWSKIQDRITGPARIAVTPPRPARPGLWGSLTLWRGAAGFATVAALVLAVLLAQAPPPQPTARMMVVMTDSEANPRITVSWPAAGTRQPRELQVRVIGHAEMAPGTAWELWCLPGGGRPPLSMGLITTDVDQAMQVPKDKWPELDTATGMAMSIEPKGGSPTGLPTGPVLYSGPRVEI